MQELELRVRKGGRRGEDKRSPLVVEVDDDISLKLQHTELLLYFVSGHVLVRDNKGYGERLANYILGVASWTLTEYVDGNPLNCKKENLRLATFQPAEKKRKVNYSLNDVL
jgi:hypothetical protein